MIKSFSFEKSLEIYCETFSLFTQVMFCEGKFQNYIRLNILHRFGVDCHLFFKGGGAILY